MTKHVCGPAIEHSFDALYAAANEFRQLTRDGLGLIDSMGKDLMCEYCQRGYVERDTDGTYSDILG